MSRNKIVSLNAKGRLGSKCSEERKEQGSNGTKSEREPTAGGDSAVLWGAGGGRLTSSGSVESLSDTLESVEAAPGRFIGVDGTIQKGMSEYIRSS